MSLDLKTIVQGAVGTAFGLVDQALKDITLLDMPGAGAYDIATNTRAQGQVQTYTFKGLLYQSREQKLSEDSAKTMTALINQIDLVTAGFTGTITSDDELVIDGATWNVTRADPDPVNATLIIALRK